MGEAVVGHKDVAGPVDAVVEELLSRGFERAEDEGLEALDHVFLDAACGSEP